MEKPTNPKRTFLSVEVEPAEKELFQRLAKSRRLTLSALTRLLLLDECERLGVK